MQSAPNTFARDLPHRRTSVWGDAVVLMGVALLIYGGIRLALSAPTVVEGPDIDLSPRSLPLYATFSVARMAVAYALSLLFTLVYGYVAAYNRRAEQILMPLLDVLQSVPILSFLPVVLLSLSVLLPEGIAAELAAVVLIFTSQVWNLTFAWYQSLTTIPKELHEASATFRFSPWLRFKTLELPFAMSSLIWNSMMSWAGGWFFLMAAEIFTVGQRDFRLLGLGSYLKEAAAQGNGVALAWGLAALILVIVVFDQFAWRPLLAWADHFRIEMVESESPPTAWFYDALRASRLVDWFSRRVTRPLSEKLDLVLMTYRAADHSEARSNPRRSGLTYVFGGALAVGLLYGGYHALLLLLSLPASQWAMIGVGISLTLLRVSLALAIALAWTIPVGVAIGTNPRLAGWLQPLVQIAASVPATALFPVFLVLVIGLPGGLNLAAILLMLAGTQWYLLFNVIAGATAIPQDLKYTSSLLRLSGWARWRTLILPSLFPYIITGAITASGGAWNASIVAEYVEFSGQTLQTIGVGALIAQATAQGDYPLLLAATMTLVVAVVTLNRLVWHRLYRLAENRYRME